MDFEQEEFDQWIDRCYVKEEMNDGWVEGKNEKNVIIWTKTDGPEMFEKTDWEKTEVIYPITFNQCVQIYTKEISSLIKKQKIVKKYEVLEEGKDTDLFLFIMKIPIPFTSQRYSVIRRRWRLDKENNILYAVNKTIEDGDRKLNLKKGTVKMRNIQVRKFETHEDGTTKVTTFSAAHAGGNIQKLAGMMEKLGGKIGMLMKRNLQERESWTNFVKEMKVEDDEEEEEED